MNWHRFKNFAASATGRLAASYLLVIMAMSVGYSVVLYSASALELQRQIPPPSVFQELTDDVSDDSSGRSPVGNDGRPPHYRDFFEARAEEGRRTLLGRLALLNLTTLVAGGGLSYYLARRTLKPIEDSVEAQSQFVSDASHELRTPLTTIRTSNEVALRDKGMTLRQSKALLRQNLEEADKLQALTDGLLKLARGDAGAELPLEPVSLQGAANEAMNRVLIQAQANDIAIDDSVPNVLVIADHASLVQVMVILLDNATKYSPPGSTVSMLAGKKGKSVVFRVRDQGPGIRPYDLRRIFDRFYRADQSRSGRNISGHGIGLSLAKKLVERQGGEISATSVVGKGSMFSITLPLVK